jgi:hypothetical protein
LEQSGCDLCQVALGFRTKLVALIECFCELGPESRRRLIIIEVEPVEQYVEIRDSGVVAVGQFFEQDSEVGLLFGKVYQFGKDQNETVEPVGPGLLAFLLVDDWKQLGG